MEHTKLMSILDGISEAIYIADPQSHEMLYANSSVIDIFGPFAGKKCFKYMQGIDAPCSFCSNDKIFGENAGNTYVWEFYNSINDRWYRCIDRAIKWPDGRLVRSEIAVDIDDMKRHEEELGQYRNQLNELVTERTKRIHNLAELSMKLIGEPDEIFGNIIRSLGEILSVKLVCLSGVHDKKTECLYLYRDGELVPNAGSCEIQGGSYSQFKKNMDFEIYNDVQTLFPESAFLKECNANSYCAIPCADSRGEILAVLIVVDDKQRHYSGEDMDIIRIIGQRIGKEMERHKIEVELNDSERKYRGLYENAQVALFRTRISDGKMIECNEKLALIFGYDDRSDCLNNFSSRAHYADPHSRSIMLSKIKEDGEINDFDAPAYRKDGTHIWVRYSAKIYPESGFLEGVVTEITEQKKAEAALRESEERYALIIEGASDGIWDRDLVNNEVYFSRRWKQMLGYGEEEFPNDINKLYMIIHPDDLEMVKGAINEHLEGKTSHYICEFRIRHKDGSYRWVLARGATKRDRFGKAIRFAGSHTDITERKLMEEELLKGRRLESIGVLAGGIAHDFNNILTGVLTNLEVAKDCMKEQEMVDEDVVKSLSYAESAAMRAVDLTRQLLTFSKGGAPVLKTVSVAELLVETASFVLRGSNVKRRCFISDDLWNAKIDENQISQVINNLVINAKQAMPEGGTVTIRAENTYIDKGDIPSLKAGKYLKISIKDRGCGIPEENLLKIFDPYFTTKSKGSGLGLATSYTIVKRHSGRMIVESEIGVGTLFEVYLPASEEVPVQRKKKTANNCHGFGRVLLLEDEDIVAESVNMITTSAGYELKHARDGKEAVKLYENAMKKGASFDVVMMDLTIAGGMGGAETIKRLKKIDPFIKAIVCSGYSDDDLMANYSEHGFCDVLPKPFTRDEVLEKLANLMRGAA